MLRSDKRCRRCCRNVSVPARVGREIGFGCAPALICATRSFLMTVLILLLTQQGDYPRFASISDSLPNHRMNFSIATALARLLARCFQCACVGVEPQRGNQRGRQFVNDTAVASQPPGALCYCAKKSTAGGEGLGKWTHDRASSYATARPSSGFDFGPQGTESVLA